MQKATRFAVTLAALMLATGCIRTRVVITTNPSQADVFVNAAPRGRTPVDVPITWYWYYDIKVVKEGFRTVESRERFRSPVWATFPLDLLAEAIPFPIPDRRYRHYDLTPE